MLRIHEAGRRGVLGVGGVAVLGMMFYVVASVVARMVFNQPLPALSEVVARWLLVPLVCAGWLVAEYQREQIKVDVLFTKLSQGSQTTVTVLNGLLTMFLMGAITHESWGDALTNMGRGEYGIDSGLAIWWTRFFIPASAGMLVVLAVQSILQHCRRR